MNDNEIVISDLKKDAGLSPFYILVVVIIIAALFMHGKWQLLDLPWLLLLVPFLPRIVRYCLLLWSVTKFIWLIEHVQPVSTEIQTQFSWWWDDLVIRFELREVKVRALIVKSWSKDRSRKNVVDVYNGEAAIYLDPEGGHGAVIETDNGYLFVHCQF